MDEKKKEPKEKKVKKKKESMNINLPKARASMRRSREMSQMKTNRSAIWSFIGGIILLFAVAFVLLGGINQRAAWETMKEFGQKIGSTVSSWFNGTDIEANENGIYIVP